MRAGYRIVALGGGTGLASLLLGIKHLPIEHLAAVVTVSDDGGSTGRLREEFDIPAVGDLRHCLVALAEDDELLSRLFAFRFSGDGALGGHCLGNLLLAALMEITGDFALAARLSAEVLKVRGTILPATSANVHLVGRDASGRRLEGEREITALGPPVEVLLEPADPPAVAEAVTAIRSADLVLLGPGSLFTSLVPNLLVPGVVEALQQRRGPLVYIANLMTQARETVGLSLEDHVDALARHAPGIAPDLVLANTVPPSEAARRRYAAESQEPLVVAKDAPWAGPGRLLPWPLLVETEDGLVRHDRGSLANAVAHIAEGTP